MRVRVGDGFEGEELEIFVSECLPGRKRKAVSW